MMDTRFSSAIHMLILISEAEAPMTSAEIAKSVGTNPSYIRRITGLLKKNKIIESRQGIGGFKLLIPSRELTLYKVYHAVSETDKIHVFDLHQNPSDRCIVGRHIKPFLKEVFREAEEKAEQQLKNTTLLDCIDTMRAEAERNNEI